MTQRIEFMGLPFDAVTMEQSIDRCLEWCADDKPARTLMTINAALLMMMRSDAGLLKACEAGDLIVADGLPVVWATKIVGTPLAGRVAGVDLMQNLLQAGHDNKLKIFLLGAKQEVIDRMLEICARQYPDLVIAGSRNGYFTEDEHAEIAAQIRDSKADILFIGMPSPFKEIWGEKYRNELGVSVIMGVGGSFDVIAGYVMRAPVWMQNIGMEWFWRLMMEPRKMWKRYLVNNSHFIYRLMIEFYKARFLAKANNNKTDN